jgi:hypothetical protein
MAGRIRTTKKLSQRIDRGYFKRSFPIPHWRRVLAIGLTVIGLAWAGWGIVSGKVYTAGPVAHAHKVIGNNCETCHIQPATWGTTTADMTCLKCHDAPAHQTSQTFTPACTTCHVEHKDAARLASTAIASCTTCHSDLKIKEGTPKYAANIRSFSNGHPEFAAVKDGHPPDPGTIKLNHQIHLKKDLRGPKGPVQMVCTDCHHEAVPGSMTSLTLPASVSPQDAAAANAMMTPQRKSLSPEIMPVSYEADCKSCHPLNFDPRLPSAPHRDAKTVEDFVRLQYAEYFKAHPNEAHQPIRLTLAPDAPYNRISPNSGGTNEVVASNPDEAIRLLFQKDCKECHDLTYPAPDSRPDIPKANETVKWMKNAWFDHKAHQLVDCKECHTDAPNSTKTADVLLPKIETCKKCHMDGSNAASDQCSECHVYHDWSKAKPVKDARTISQIVK